MVVRKQTGSIEEPVHARGAVIVDGSAAIEMPPTLEEALKLASQLEAVEEAQKRLQKDKCHLH